MVDVIHFYFVDYLLRVLQRFGDVGEDFRHFIGCFEPFLLRIMHAVDIVHVVVGAQADKAVVCFGIFFVNEVRIIGGNQLHAVFAGKVDQHGVDLFLPLVNLHICAGFLGLMPLQLDIIVLSEEVFEPLYSCFRLAEVAVFRDSIENFLRQLTSQARRAADDSFVPALQQLLIYTRRMIERIGHVARGHAEVVITHHILRQQDQVPAGPVDDICPPLAVDGFVLAFRQSSAACAVSLHTHDGFERHEGLSADTRFHTVSRTLAVHFLAVVQQVLDTVHIAMIGQRHGVHSGRNTFIYNLFHFGQPVQQRVVRVNMQMCKSHKFKI